MNKNERGFTNKHHSVCRFYILYNSPCYFKLGILKPTGDMPPVDFCFPNIKLMLDEGLFIYWWDH